MNAKMAFELPQLIARFIGKARLVPNTVGESPCPVYRFKRGKDIFFLKMCSRVYSPTTFSVQREADVLAWLSGQLNVPEVVCVAQSSQGEFMITRSVPGQPLYQRMYVVKQKWTAAGEKRREGFNHFELAEKYDFSAVLASTIA